MASHPVSSWQQRIAAEGTLLERSFTIDEKSQTVTIGEVYITSACKTYYWALATNLPMLGWREPVWSLLCLLSIESDRIYSHGAASVKTHPTIKDPPKVLVYGTKRPLSSAPCVSTTVVSMVSTTHILEDEACHFLHDRQLVNKETASRHDSSHLDSRWRIAAFVIAGMVPGQLQILWQNEAWTGNSVDLNLIRNLWATLQAKSDKVHPAITLSELRTHAKKAWISIERTMLSILLASIPRNAIADVKVWEVVTLTNNCHCFCYCLWWSFRSRTKLPRQDVGMFLKELRILTVAAAISRTWICRVPLKMTHHRRSHTYEMGSETSFLCICRTGPAP